MPIHPCSRPLATSASNVSVVPPSTLLAHVHTHDIISPRRVMYCAQNVRTLLIDTGPLRGRGAASRGLRSRRCSLCRGDVPSCVNVVQPAFKRHACDTPRSEIDQVRIRPSLPTPQVGCISATQETSLRVVWSEKRWNIRRWRTAYVVGFGLWGDRGGARSRLN